MKFKLLVLFSICLTFYQCKNGSQPVLSNNINTDSIKYVLNIENDSCKIEIKEIDKSKLFNLSNGYSYEPRLDVRADCLSLKELVGIIRNIDTSIIITNSQGLKNKFYSVLIKQNTRTNQHDSMIINDIIKAFDINIEKKIFSIDTTFISMNDLTKYKKYSSITIGDTVFSKYRISEDLIEFENTGLDGIVAHLSKIFNKALILDTKVSQRIDYKIRRNDWESIKDKLESDLGIHFNTQVTQIEKYVINDQSYVLK